MTRKQLVENIARKRSFLCVGLDPDINKIPSHIVQGENPLYEFCRQIVDATAPYAVAYKPNLAFFEAYGWQGVRQLEMLVSYIKENHLDQFVIADAKRGDIGNTAAMYAKGIFEVLNADACTVAPYMGSDSVTPFTDYPGKWTILLDLTSNKGSLDLQMTENAEGQRLFERVLEVSQQWGTEENLMYVVGATRGQLIADVRRVAPRHFLLVPGVGAQGGSLEEVARYGMTPDCGLLVNSSRGIIYASRGEDFAEVAAVEASKLRDQMSGLLPL